MKGSRKALAVGCSVATHLLLLWALLPMAVEPQIEAGVISASLVDGVAPVNTLRAAAPAQAAPAVERRPEPVKVQPDIDPLPVSEDLPPLDATAEPIAIGDAASTQVAAMVAVAAVAAEGDPCAVGEWLQAALQNDPSVHAALATVPRSARSVANAVMLWNGQWPPPPAGAEVGMARIRALVLIGIQAAPESCQTQLLSGPVLVTVGDRAETTVLAVGSGQWRWRDLLQNNQQMQ